MYSQSQKKRSIKKDANLRRNDYVYIKRKYCFSANTVRFIKPYRNPVHKCTGLRLGFMKWAVLIR